jgi:hypothetical protein
LFRRLIGFLQDQVCGDRKSIYGKGIDRLELSDSEVDRTIELPQSRLN